MKIIVHVTVERWRIDILDTKKSCRRKNLDVFTFIDLSTYSELWIKYGSCFC